MQSLPPYFLGVLHSPRTVAWGLAGVILTFASLQMGGHRWLWALVGLCLTYPHAVQWFLTITRTEVGGILSSLMLDAILVGVLAGVIVAAPIAGVVMTTMLIASVVMVGGIPLLLCVIPFLFTGLSLSLTLINGPAPLDLELCSYGALVIYAAYLAWLVYQETRRLNIVNQHEFSLRRQLEQIREKLIPFVAPEVMRHSAATSAMAQRRRLTVFFSDIQGFTALMDTIDETEVARWLNAYFEEMNRIAMVHGGTVDKFLGDGMMVFFGDPDTTGPVSDAYSCVSMALDMQTRFNQMAEQLPTRQTIQIRMGIHTGYCLVGRFGSPQRMDYTALGGTVNQASRIEGYAGGGEVLISDDTYRLLRPWIVVKDRGLAHLKGLIRPVSVYGVVGLACRGNGKYLAGQVRLLS